MKKQGVVWITVLLLAETAWGQYGYLYQSGGWMFGADFIGQEGWMVGAGGAILHTQDGGRNWLFQRNIQGYDAANPGIFCAVTFKNQRLGWVLSSTSPVVWRTTDGGQYWAAESIPSVNRPSSKISFADTLRGWLVRDNGPGGGDIVATADGGGTWMVQNSNHAYTGVWAGSPNRCWAVGYLGWIARTTDGGQNWLEQQIGSNTGLYDVVFTDTLYGWACGYSGAVVHTTDGGVSWTAQTSGTARDLQALAFLDRMNGFAVGDTGTLLKTTDGGANWTLIPTGIDVELAAISFGDSLHGWAVGVEGGAILETGDGGTTWRVSRKGIAGPVATPFPGRRTERVQAISFVDDSTGWAASWEGCLWHTHDGGKVWSKQDSVSRKRLLSLAMVNANTGWAVGDSGLILATQNGGLTWVPQRGGRIDPLWSIFASDPQHAWTSGPWLNFFQTSNGGTTWDSLSILWPQSSVVGVASVDTLYGWALFENASVWATTNGGRTWSSRYNGSGMGLLKISFVDSAWGWTVGDLGISRSTDGGRNWQVQNNQTGMKDVSALTRTKAWAVGATGAILATTNGGTSWFSQIPPVSQDFLSVSFSDTLHGLVGGANYYVLVTSNGGATWDTVRASSSRLKDVCLIESLYGWFVDYYGDIQRTTDGGRTWQTMINRPNLVSVHFANRDTGWVAQETKILKTTNGGVSWDSLSVGLLWSRTINDARLLSGKTGMIATGWPGQPQIPAILKVTWDGGTRWSSYRWLWNMSYRKAGSHLSTTLGCFAGSGGSHAFRLRSDLTWDVASIAQESLGYAQGSPSVWGLDFVDSSTGWAVGQNGARVITTDGGVSWRLQKIDSGIGSVLTSVKAFNTQTARAIGYLGRSVLTTDGGITWVNEETGTDEWLLTSSFLSPTQGWVAGEDGMVLKYGLLPSGVETERGGTPNTWITALEQNRPNPFQDETGIRYQLARKEHVRLIVYNVLGQAVRRLVDGTQTPGAYVVSWDGKDGAEHPSPSGVYFYRLEAGGQSQTRKTVKVR